jgi:hypothetical protein
MPNDGDRLLTGDELRRLFREWTHDYGLRRLEDRGVKYEDERDRAHDDAGDVIVDPEEHVHRVERQGFKEVEAPHPRQPSPSEIARGTSPATPEQSNGQYHAREEDRGRGR